MSSPSGTIQVDSRPARRLLDHLAPATRPRCHNRPPPRGPPYHDARPQELARPRVVSPDDPAAASRATNGARPTGTSAAGERIVACRRCPKFDARRAECGVPFGSPLRKCVVAATEAHLRATRGLRVLELGYARRSYGKRIVELAGGSWTGVEPLARSQSTTDSSARAATGMPATSRSPTPRSTSCSAISRSSTGRSRCRTARRRRRMRSAWPRSGACCAPAARCISMRRFTCTATRCSSPATSSGSSRCSRASLWTDVTVERWRYDHEPLPRYPTPAADIGYMRGTIKSYDLAKIAEAANQRHGLVVDRHGREARADAAAYARSAAAITLRYGRESPSLSTARNRRGRDRRRCGCRVARRRARPDAATRGSRRRRRRSFISRGSSIATRRTAARGGFGRGGNGAWATDYADAEFHVMQGIGRFTGVDTASVDIDGNGGRLIQLDRRARVRLSVAVRRRGRAVATSTRTKPSCCASISIAAGS